jgi:hypothetical protein
MKSKKQIQLEWAIIYSGTLVVCLLLAAIVEEWSVALISSIACSLYYWGWYRCWKFHKIGWKEDKPNRNHDLIAGVPRSGTSVSVELITGLKETEKED